MIGIHRLTPGIFGLTLLLVTAGACSKEVTQLQNGQEPAPANTSDNSNALLMPAGTNAAAAVGLPAELVSFDTSAAKSTPFRADIYPNDKSPKISLDCAAVKHARIKNIRFVTQLIKIVSATETNVIAEGHFDPACKDLVLSVQNLPKEKNLKLVALIGNDKVRFRGETEQFIFDGTQTSRLSLKMMRAQTNADAIITVEFEHPIPPATPGPTIQPSLL